MPLVRQTAALLCAIGMWAQSERPTFRADRVIPSFADRPLMLAPGMLVSIYGSHLGPVEGCRGYGDQTRVEVLPADNPYHMWERMAIYPARLCDVQVTIGDAAAGLLWVQADQINFQVPKDVPFEGSAELRVIHGGAASDPVTLRFGLERMTITQDEPAYAGMPVWVQVHTAADLQRPLEYPFLTDPLWLMCRDIEVRRNGVALPRQVEKTSVGRAFPGNMCGTMGLPGKPSKPGRLPLHLFYRFDQPGTYEVRFTRMQGDGRTVRDRTEWTPVRVRGGGNRAAWLASLKTPGSVTEMLSDYLPSILGYGDAATIPRLVAALSNGNETVRQFATYGLADYYDRAAILAHLPRQGNETIERLRSMLRP